MTGQLAQQVMAGNRRSLARAISLIENEVPGYDNLLPSLTFGQVPVTGFTGPPGAGKSTLVDAVIRAFTARNLKTGVLCVDPSSPFHHGALLGDRIRMQAWFNHPGVFIRSLGSRGSLGGIQAHLIAITDVMKAAGFDHILVETVGVGQSEVEIAALADTTVVVLVPESGDDIQMMKAGLLEIADVFAVNKSDREGAALFVKNLRAMLMTASHAKKPPIPVIQTVATHQTGIEELVSAILNSPKLQPKQHRYHLLAEKAYRLIVQKKMKGVTAELLQERIAQLAQDDDFNLYRFVNDFAAPV